MFEYDEHGQEWIGYSFGSDEDDPQAVISAFTGNVQYLEWYYRQIVGKSGKSTLAEQVNHLFSLLPHEAELAITDDRQGLVRSIVRTRNRYAHGKFEQEAPSIARVHTLSIKIAALLTFAERVHEGHPNETIAMAKGGSPYLREKLGQSDRL